MGLFSNIIRQFDDEPESGEIYRPVRKAALSMDDKTDGYLDANTSQEFPLQNQPGRQPESAEDAPEFGDVWTRLCGFAVGPANRYERRYSVAGDAVVAPDPL